jgi:hypothetical protein
MSEDIDWNEEAAAFDANAAVLESRIVWLKLAYQFRDVATGFSDFLESPKAADEAMAWAARSEACMWRATGDMNSIDADRFIPELRAPSPAFVEGSE